MGDRGGKFVRLFMSPHVLTSMWRNNLVSLLETLVVRNFQLRSVVPVVFIQKVMKSAMTRFSHLLLMFLRNIVTSTRRRSVSLQQNSFQDSVRNTSVPLYPRRLVS